MRLGIVNVERDILRCLTAKQFRGWQHYFELEISEDLRADYRAASIVQILYNINRGKGQQALTLEECLLKFGEQPEKQQQTPGQQFAMLKVLAAMHAGDAEAPKASDGARTAEEQQALEASIEAELARARKAMH